MKRSRLLALAATAAAARALPAAAQTLPKVRVGTIAVESGCEASYAYEQGFFKNAGLDVELISMPNGGTATAAVLSGTIDVGISNVSTIASAYARGLPIYLLAYSAVYSSAAPTTVLVVAKDAPLRVARDLNGKNVGVVTLHDLMQASVQRWLDQNGTDSATISFLEIPNSAAAAALQAGRVAASVIQEPVLTTVKADVRAFGQPYDAIGKRMLITGFGANKAWADANPAAAKSFVAAMRATAEWANRNQRATAAILSTISKIPLEVTTTMNRSVYATSADVSLLQPVIDTAAQYKIIGKSFPAAELYAPALRSS
jgi:NitT/TauT family transport system substrate-binding protein